MQLKKIILKGFKSFPEKTTLEFDEGITAIVGPNGSGKSNIIEAIRWVMGEQSAKTLRGNRMNDVIFSGTSERKPLNIAEVELILDNADGYLDISYEEVSVARRISRTGESTYMINQQECRLKDIVDLFMDSGLGKESFSVISQGQVEAVFNSKPEDRRGIFEEAAGVYKYKIQKTNAEKKLDQTQENLDRVQDIIYELEAQLEPLRRQADIASSYLEQKEKLTDLDIGVTVMQIKDLKEQIVKSTQERDELAKELTKNENNIQELSRKQKAQAKNLEDIEEQRDALNHQLLKIVREKERTEAALNLFDEKAKHQDEFIQEKENTIKNIKQRNVLLEADYDEIQAKYSEKSDVLKNLSDEIAALKEQIEYLEGDKEAQVEELRRQYIDLLQKQTSLKNEKQYIEQEITRNNRAIFKSDQQITELTENKEVVEAELKQKSEVYEITSRTLHSLVKQYKTCEESLKQVTADNRVKAERIAQVFNDLERAKAKKASLEQMQENYAGYYTGVRAVMQASNELTGVVGTVAESIKIPKEYVQAIDTVLASTSQFIIVDDEKAGRAGINYLKRTKKGRATFLPLTTIKPRFIPDTVQKQVNNIPGFIGIASDLVKNDPKVQTIIDNLLGHTIVADTLEAANEIARIIKFRNRVVSLEGDVINAGGSMTGGGGRQSNTSPIFTQKTELQEAKKFINENSKFLQKLEANQAESVTKQETLAQELNDLRQQGEDKRIDEQNFKHEVDTLENQLSRLTRELQATSFESTETKTVHESCQIQLEQAEISLTEVDLKVTKVNDRMKLLASEQENIDEEKSKLIHQLEQTRTAYNDMREELASIRANRKNLSNQINENNEQIENLQADIESFDQDVGDISKEELQTLLGGNEAKEGQIGQEQEANKKAYVKANQLNQDLNIQLNNLSNRNKYLTEEKSKFDVQISRNDVRMDHNLDYLAEEYKISFEEAKLLNKPDLPFAEAQKQVKLLKKGIAELGPVNLNSIEEYKSINERFSFLTDQQNDLINAKANLYNTMDEMDAIVESRFKETYDRIQKEFALVFPKMFGGGYAELVLSDPDNLLETGIEIIAQPPGKRLTRLSLLSGGERALTAISLLFAIIQVNPIPFCILDEAEAALDDANVVRFGNYLQDFDFDTQFIVITHRKGTMEHSDQLYGVTMQEKGISKIVAVSLNDAKKMDGVT